MTTSFLNLLWRKDYAKKANNAKLERHETEITKIKLFYGFKSRKMENSYSIYYLQSFKYYLHIIKKLFKNLSRKRPLRYMMYWFSAYCK